MMNPVLRKKKSDFSTSEERVRTSVIPWYLLQYKSKTTLTWIQKEDPVLIHGTQGRKPKPPYFHVLVKDGIVTHLKRFVVTKRDTQEDPSYGINVSIYRRVYLFVTTHRPLGSRGR